ncbi:MAG: sugar ABC transporter permease [Propionibacteriaceae bacterium]|jgi:ABC-type sugar transport system permease subunit|nr:sugar ABC transporter permease [Propionibacteriaceae bacterium]
MRALSPKPVSGRALSPPGHGRIRRARWGGWSLAIIPALAAGWLVVYPLVFNVWTSLHINRLSPNDGQWSGLKSYQNLLKFGDLAGTLSTTLVWTVSSIVFQGLFGFALALALDRPGRGISLARTLLMAPWVIPGVVVAAVWVAIYNPINGLANAMLGWVGLGPVDFLGDPDTALLSLVVVNVWKGMPFWMLMLSAGLKAVPRDLYEAAQLDGASYLKQVRHVAIPGIRNVLALTAVLAFIWTFNYFDSAYAMTQGGPGRATTTLPFDIYKTAFVFNRFDQGAALSVISFVLMAVAIGFYMRMSRKGADND